MSVEKIADALLAEGFRPCKPKTRGGHCFAGEIPCNGRPVPVEVEVTDLDFTELPRIRVIRRPEQLSGFHPHFMADDELCYANRHEIVLDRYRPGESVVGCLRKASSVLDALSKKDAPDDTHQEFLAYWPGLRLFIDCPVGHKGIAGLNFLTTRSSERVLVASVDASKLVSHLEGIGWKCDHVLTGNCFVLSSAVVPSVDIKSWPPMTMESMLRWIRTLDVKTYDRIYVELANGWILNAGLVAFVIQSSTATYGFWFTVDRTHRKTCKRKPSLYRQYLMSEKGGKTVVNLLSGNRFDQDFIHRRNLAPSDKNLHNKSVLVAGCGTIGGYLATYLARLGAGQGAKGRLILVDPDKLAPENLGRHTLGMEALLENKAEAVTSVIKRDFPYLNVISRPIDVRDVKELMEVDLVIDATGEEALSAALNEKFTGNRIEKKKTPAVLHAWITGQGVAVQCLLVDSLGTACYRCLRVEQEGVLAHRFGVLKDTKNQLVRVGCDSYMPFPVSASVQAASLALDIALDWVRGNPTPRFRTRLLNDKTAKIVKDQDATPLEQCPACRKR
jgi:hypothetical protein